MGSFGMRLDSDTDYEVLYIVKEVRKKIGKYSKSQCIQDIVKVGMINKNNLLVNILDMYK